MKQSITTKIIVCIVALGVLVVAVAMLAKQMPENEQALRERLSDIAEHVEVGTAGSSLKAAAPTAALMDWGVATPMTATEIDVAVKRYLATASPDFTEQLMLVKDTYQLLLTDDGKEYLETAGYEGNSYPWDMKTIPAVDAVFTAAGI